MGSSKKLEDFFRGDGFAGRRQPPRTALRSGISCPKPWKTRDLCHPRTTVLPGLHQIEHAAAIFYVARVDDLEEAAEGGLKRGLRVVDKDVLPRSEQPLDLGIVLGDELDDQVIGPTRSK